MTSSIRLKMPSTKSIQDTVWLVTARVLNSYEHIIKSMRNIKKILRYILSGIIYITKAYKKYKKLHPHGNFFSRSVFIVWNTCISCEKNIILWNWNFRFLFILLCLRKICVFISFFFQSCYIFVMYMLTKDFFKHSFIL